MSDLLKHCKDSVKSIKGLLSDYPLPFKDPDLMLKRCLNEAWFSNTLAWLLDPKGSHGLGVKFAREFLVRIAQIRSADSNGKYATKASLLRWGKGGSGTLANNGFSLNNASAVRELYLSQALGKRRSRNQRYCDVALLDLDPWDGVMVIIENKLFTANRPFQLEEYYDVVEEKFKRTKVREYVYLTIFGNDPIDFEEESTRKLGYWVRMSWATDIAGVLEKVWPESPGPALKRLKKLLHWLETLNDNIAKEEIDQLWQTLTSVAAFCLLEELNRLGDGKTGSWDQKRDGKKRTTLIHSSRPKSPLYVELLPNFSITVQSQKSGKAVFEKIIVPYGANADQCYNLLDIAARDIYYAHFGDQVARYLDAKRRLRTTESDEREALRSWFDFIAKHSDELKLLFLFSQKVWDAEKEATEEEMSS